MARTYYDTPQRVFQLFKNHPALSQMYEEFGVDIDGIKRVSEFLVLNHDKIEEYDLQDIYKSSTPDTLEADQDDPVKGTVATFNLLPTTGIQEDEIWHVEEPYPGSYYYWDGGVWREDPAARDKSNIQYLNALYKENGHKVWEPESGYYVAVEHDHNISWQEVSNTTPDYTIIRMSELPKNPNPGDIYYVVGEDLIDIVASLYGFVEMGMTPPWSNYVSAAQTNLQQLLTMSVYLYRYGVTDNFYEKNIWHFIPEYDRDQMLEQPKTKLFMESVGRKLDQIEDKLTRLQNVYDIDETPDELLDHLGQMLGYEREDSSLSGVSFRELLKNIIEIYKVKGTNYSFSFFFKFLGFNVNLKEFYFNRDVRNPESFPGVEDINVEYYLTTTNPIEETQWGNPAPHLENIRSLNDWDLEIDLLEANGCDNPARYMLGLESYNNDGSTYHQNPWTYFKTNLIEYELNPFFEKVNLTSSDNETIRKYIKFLSPTYLFTWININLYPWIEDVNIFDNVDEWLEVQIGKTFGDTIDGEYRDYENVVDYFQVWDEKQNKLIPYTEADDMTTSIVNYLNLGGDDQVGAFLRHDGVYIRQPGHPSHITNVFHDGSKRLNFDNLGIMIKPTADVDYDNLYTTLLQLPNTSIPGTIAYVEETELYYIYKDPSPEWEILSLEESPSSVPQDHIYNSYTDLVQIIGVVGDVYKVIDTGRYYRYHDDPAYWGVASVEERYSKWLDYSFRPYPTYPTNVKPSPGVRLNTNTINFVWDDIYMEQGYWIQLSRDSLFSNVILEDFIYDSKNYIESVNLNNDNYFWRVRVKNNLSIQTLDDATYQSIYNKDSDVENYYTQNGSVWEMNSLSGFELNDLIGLLAENGFIFDWNQWSSIYRFEIDALPFPQDGQVIDDRGYQYIDLLRDQYTDSIIGAILTVEWEREQNVEMYEVVVSTDTGFNTIVESVQVNENRKEFELGNGTYYWRWRYKEYNNDWNDWSENMMFTIDV